MLQRTLLSIAFFLALTLPSGCTPSPGPSDRTSESSSAVASPGDSASRASVSSSVSSSASSSAFAPTHPVTVVPPDMLGVPGGTFVMGLDDQGEMDERPAHPVTVAPLLLDTTEVSNEAYFRCVREGPCKPHNPASAEANHFGSDAKFRTPKRPISGVSREDAETYCGWVGKRLPTEAEWERAARGSDGRLYPWGDEKPTDDRAVFGRGITADVGSVPAGAGPYGHLDLAGNVWEWVADRYDPYAYRRPSASRAVPGSCDEILATLAELRAQGKQGFTGSNPIPNECEYTLRGGAFNYGPWGLRASNRVHHPERFRLVMSGFRCALDWPDGPTERPAAAPAPSDSAPDS